MNDLEKVVIELDGVWPGGTGGLYECRAGGYHVGQGISSGSRVCTYGEFMECRALLENKPKESEWPKWAAGVAQDKGGKWYAYSQRPDNLSETQHYASGDCEYKELSAGHVFGDWRESWTPRSEPAYKPEDVAFKADKNSFQWDGSDYPSIGDSCEYRIREDSGKWVKSFVLAREGDWLWLKIEGRKTPITATGVENFRVVDTKRERFADVAWEALLMQGHVGANGEIVGGLEPLSALYDAGFRMPEEE